MKEYIPMPFWLRKNTEKKLKASKSPEARMILQNILDIDDLKNAIQELQDIVRKNKLE